MSPTGRRKSTSVIQQLAEYPHKYCFFQAVRLLERSSAFKNIGGLSKMPVAGFTPPKTEAIRFYTNQSLSFPSSEISAITRKENKSSPKQWGMTVNFMGLSGVSGVLPLHYTELILRRLKSKDESMREFFDLFNHRTISLFYKAANKYRFPVDYERNKLTAPDSKNKQDQTTNALLSLMGLGTNNLTDRLHTNDESLIYYSGLFTQRVKTASGLKRILQNHFAIPVDIKEFIGQWQVLIDDVRTRLPGQECPQGQNNSLGKSVMLGRKGWFAQGKISIILGPLDRSQLYKFSPGTSALKALDEIVRLYVGFEINYDFIIRIKRSDLPNRIKLTNKKPPIIGWNTWLSSNPNQHYGKNETVDISVSASRLLDNYV